MEVANHVVRKREKKFFRENKKTGLRRPSRRVRDSLFRWRRRHDAVHASASRTTARGPKVFGAKSAAGGGSADGESR